MKSVQQVVREELVRFLEAEDYVRLGSVQQLEDDIGIWQWGKAALLGDSTPLGIQRQIKFKARIQEGLSMWHAIDPMNDEEFQVMDRIISRLAQREREIIKRMYMYWESSRDAANEMRIPRHKFLSMQGMALAFIKGAKIA